MLKDIPFFQGYDSIECVTKGFSADSKYKVKHKGRYYMVRFFSLETYKEREEEFLLLKQVQQVTSKSLKAIEMGKTKEKGYMITNFFEGIDMEEGLASIPEEKQYEIGILAGRELANIHKIHAPLHISPWHERKKVKYERYKMKYLAYGLFIDGQEELFSFVENNIHLMKNRPNMLQHDDFHPSNLIMKEGELEGIIDFERYDWGDPIEDFMKIGLFTRGISEPFSKGQIKGYFSSKEPGEDIWKLYNLYMAMTVLSALVWGKELHPTNLEFLMNRCQIIMDDHENFKRLIPKWYV